MDLPLIPFTHIGPAQTQVVVMGAYHNALGPELRFFPGDHSHDISQHDRLFWMVTPVYPGLVIICSPIPRRLEAGLPELSYDIFSGPI
jgi:hypothetical protein